MKTSALNQDQLFAYFAEHVRYEMQHLINATDAISRQLSIHNGLQYMVVESFAIHLRNLITFLYPYTKRDTDVCATDFFTHSGAWDNLRPKLSDVLEQAKTRTDKEVGHLTTFRQFGVPRTKIWDVTGLCDEIMPILKLFCESADKVKLDAAFTPIWQQYTFTTTLRS